MILDMAVWLSFAIFVLSLHSLSALPAPKDTSAEIVGTVYYRSGDGRYSVTLGTLDKKGAAYGSFQPTVNTTGWGVLNVVVNAAESKLPDDVLMHAAGYLEGALTQQLIYYQFQNMRDIFFSNTKPEVIERVRAWYLDQRFWMGNMIKQESEHSTFWMYAKILLEQFYGLYDGYNAVAPTDEALDLFAFDFLNGNGDYLDLQNVIDSSKIPDLDKMTEEDLKQFLLRSGHCSALIKLLPGFENVYAAHSSWFVYSAMLRIYKHYDFQLNDKQYAAQRVSFSSYPGYLSSLDDFYIMDSHLVMLQTTNNIFNKEIYKNVTQKALLAWHRVRLANWLASSGKDWCETLSMYNSGTYNNQYMVLDLSKFHEGQALGDDALWVAEQIPGYVHIGDQTAILREGYWASYNVPFYEDVFDMSGYPDAVKKAGPSMTHDLAPRAEIFRRDQGKVTNMETFQHIMRYNEYKTDPYSKGDASNAICSRGDLRTNPSFGGCYDTKVTDYAMALKMNSLAISGPTYQDEPVFKWSDHPDSSASAPHRGQPNKFNFLFISMSPAEI